MNKNTQKTFLINHLAQVILLVSILILFVTRFGVINAVTRSQASNESVFVPQATSHTPRTTVAPAIELTELPVEKKDEATVEQTETDATSQDEEAAQESPNLTETPVSSETPTTSVTQAQTTSAPAQSGSEEAAAKEFIAQKESGGSYTAQNGRFYGRYQLDRSYLNGDLSPENQERVADAYVAGRYGSWVAAKAFWLSHNWY